ncbi:PLP-dependent aminotransferase family protein [Thermosediminibacter oceani]|uniref:Transcriptional regulator, GntR family with aminotransferase domain n=1 Tax=Thermosediminibacter oceani (strain ATCC BAA-1034 / DSM 16646 / JW/IW-1228P) TaxID=555079 RepID=D9S140_THEOJ|nr:PLP-dependent aminotransferase family protein [Thermosediminibacter oceani]ADL08919.1 transcriptional regulator, GntR family with aminotransferase domain [Thermosediminibacter oceani DSM 16646]
MDKYVSIQLDRSSSKPLYAQVYEDMVHLIKEGKLAPGEKLPPIRKLASMLGVNTVTIINAYRLLEREGYAVSRVGSGTYVRPAGSAVDEEGIKVEGDGTGKTPDPGEDSAFAAGTAQPGGGRSQKIDFDFAGASVSPEYFPVKIFKEALNRVLDREGGYAFVYSESPGYLPFRQSLGEYLAREYGIEAPVDSIHVVSGAQQGIDIISKAFLDFGDVVYVESPTYPGAIDAFKSRGARIVEVPMAQDGIDLEDLHAKLRSKPPKLFYTMPNFQNPTGRSYSEQKKKELLALSHKYDFLIVEDDHMNDLYYVEKPVPLKTLDGDGRVFYIKSFSKHFMPGLRLGFIVAPARFSKKIAEVKYFSDITSSGLTQRALDVMLRDGTFCEHMKKLRGLFREKWDLMRQALKKHMHPGISWTEPQGGLFFWATLPDGYYSMNLYSKALRRGLIITAGDFFYPDRLPSPCFRLSIAQVPADKLEEGIKLLSGIVSEMLEEFGVYSVRNNRYQPLL